MLGELGRVRHVLGDPSGGRELLLRALATEQEFKNQRGIAWTLTRLAAVSHDLGDAATAKVQLSEGLTVAQTINDRRAMVEALEAFAGLSAESADSYHAARLFGCAERVREGLAMTMEAPTTQFKRTVAAARRALHDDAAFDRAWDEGRSMTLDEAVRHVLGA
jgi:hypothetical protein